MIAEIIIREPSYLTGKRNIEIEANNAYDVLRIHNLVNKFKKEGKLLEFKVYEYGDCYIIHKYGIEDLLIIFKAIKKFPLSEV